MAQIVKLRRSSVSGQKPTNSNLQLGELALNTTDGKVYMAKSGSLGPSVEELISTNTVNTGSVNISGSIDLLGHQTITGSLIVTDGVGYINTGLIAENSDLTLTSGSNVYVEDGGIVSASALQGDGSGIINIPLSGITNLTTISGSIDTRLDALETLSQSFTGSISGSMTGSVYADYIVFNSSSTAPLVDYMLQANTTDKTLDLRMGNNNPTLQLGQELYYPPIVNKSGGALPNGALVMFNPADPTQGNRISVVKCISDGTYPADYIVGILTEDVAVNQEGFATWFGYVRDISRTELESAGLKDSGETWSEGQILYPHPTRPGGLTNVQPTAPNLKSSICAITSINGVNVTFLVRPHLRGTLKGLHDVNDTTTTSTYGDLLVKSGSVWKNSKSLNGNYAVTGSLTITENLTVLGSSSLVYVTSSNLAVSASFISVNVFEPAERFGGLKVYDSGSSHATASLAWDSLNNHWIYQNSSGSSYSGGMLLAGPRNSGSLGDEVGLIDGRIAKSVGGDHLDNSIMYESGSNIVIEGHLNAYSLTGSLNFGDLTDLPTLVSGSSQIEITGTTGYSTFSGSISSSIGELSSSFSASLSEVSSSISSSINSLSGSIATTTNDLDGRLDSIEGVTGSYATTGSNLFKGDQTISGSVIIGTGSLDVTSPELLHVENSGSYNIARFDGNHYSYAQINLQNHNSGSSASSDFVITADNGTENIHYVDLGINSSTYNAGYVGYENDAYLLNAGKDLYVGTVGGSGHPSNLNLFAQNSWENPQVVISGSKQISFNTGSVSNGYQYEFSGSIKADHDLNVIGNITGSNITGSFIGDGSGLYNIPASGVTGLSLDKIINGNASASIDDNGFYVNRDVYIDGTITAKEIHTDYVTSSVLFQSGSTKFGDTTDDNHNFTGSVFIDGNLNVNSITGSIDFSNLTNVPTLVSGSSQILDGSGIWSGSAQLPNGVVSGSSQILDGSGIWSGSSQLPNGVVSGSSQISYTGITDVPNGIVSSSQQVIDLGFTTTGSFESFTSSYTSASSSFDTRIDSIYGSVTGLTENFNSHTSSYMSFTSSFESYTSSYNNFTSSVVLASQTSSMTVLSSSYALTASYALNGGGGGTESRTAKLDQTLASSTWTFNHNLGEKYPAIEIFDNNDYVVIPTSIQAIDDNTLTITFSSPVSGVATATVGGGIPFISGSYNGRVLAVNDGGPTWKDGMVSGSLQIEEFGFSTTGSNSFVGNQTVTGSLTVRNAKLDATCVTVSTGTTIFDLSDFDGATFDYVVKNGGNMRAGTIVSVWDGAVSSYNETSTLDLGDTSNITFEVSGTGELNTVIAGGTWTVQVLYRALGCTS